MKYFPTLQAAQKHCKYHYQKKGSVLVKKYAALCIYRDGETKRLLGILDRVVISIEDVRMARQDLACFKFDKYGQCNGFYFTDYQAKKKR